MITRITTSGNNYIRVTTSANITIGGAGLTAEQEAALLFATPRIGTTFNLVNGLLFDRVRTDYNDYTITGANVIGIDSTGIVNGSEARITIIGNNSDTIDLTAFTQYDTNGLAFDTTKQNRFIFFRDDGIVYWIIIAQTDIPAIPQLSAPTAGAISNRTISGFRVAISGIDANATGVNVYLDSIQYGSTLGTGITYVDFTGLTEATSHNVHFIAVGNGVNYSNSNASNTVSPTTIAVAMTFVSSATSSDGTYLNITCSETVNSTPANPTGITVRVNGSPVSATSSIVGGLIRMTPSTAFETGQTITVSAASSNAVSTDGATYGGGALTDFTNQAVTNNVSANQAPYFDSISGTAPSGTAQVGQTLTAPVATYHDAESDPQGTTNYQWYRSDNNSGLNKASISAATSSTYVLQAADEGKYITVQERPTATSGTTPGTWYESGYTTQVQAEAPSIPTDYVLYHKADNSTLDESANNNDGTLNGSAGYTTGRKSDANGAYNLIKSGNSYVNIPDAASLDCSTEMTVCFWVNPATLSVTDNFLAKWDYATQGGWAIGVHPSDATNLEVYIASALNDGGSNIRTTTNASLVTGSYQFICFVFNGNEVNHYDRVKIYKNNVLLTMGFAGTIATSLQNNSASLKIGKFGGSLNRYCDAAIDDIRIYNRVLTDDEMTALYNE